MIGSIVLYGMHRLIVPARFPIFSPKPMTTTVSFGGTICTSCGLLSKSVTANVIGVRFVHASDNWAVARSVIRWTSRCSICVSGRCGMNSSPLLPPRRRSMIG